MATGQYLQPEVTILGSFGKLYDTDGAWLTEVDEVEFKITVDKEPIKMSGTRKTGHKAKSVEGTGTIRGFHVTSEWLKLVGEMQRNDRQVQFIGQLIVLLDDPEALGAERVLLKGVKFWEYAGGFKVDEVRRVEIPITFWDYELLDAISGDPSTTRPASTRFEETGS